MPRQKALLKGKVTIAGLLAGDTLSGMTEALEKELPNVESLVIIYTRKNDDQITWMANGLLLSRLIYLLEAVKIAELTGDLKENRE